MHLPKCFICLPCHYCPSFTVACLFYLAIPVANWSALVENTTTTSIRISWQNLTPVLGRRILHYFVVIKSSNGSISNGNFRSENTFSDVFYGLSPYREYRLNVIGVDEEGRAYNGSELVAWTEEGGKYTHIYNNNYLAIVNQSTHPPNNTHINEVTDLELKQH